MKYGIDDMDELFRRAADAYPLNVSSADWEKVASALPSSGDQRKSKSSYSRRRLLWLLMLLPLPFICNHTDRENPTQSTELLKAGSENGLPGAINRVVGNAHPEPGIQKRSSATKGEASALREPGSPNVASAPSTYNNANNLAGPSIARKTFTNQKAPKSVGAISRVAMKNTERRTHEDIAAVQTNASQEQGHGIRLELIHPWRPAFVLSLNAKQAALKNTVLDMPRPVRPLAPLKSGKRFYSGLVANFGWSSVKSQWSHQPDNSLGVLFGLQWNSRWAVEAGVNLDKKYYVSDGKYFKGPNPWPNASIKSLDGSCYMFEIPIDIKFNFFNRKESSWFITNGVSSYLMKKESYTYIVAYGAGATGEHYYDYKNATQNWLAIYQVSAGYEHVLGRLGLVRVEPFAKIPLTGLGVGKLPFVSAGLQVGLIHRF